VPVNHLFTYLSGRLLCAAVVPLLCAIVFPSSAAASCGDWLATSSKSHRSAAVVDDKPAKASLQGWSEPFRLPPCRGPACQSAPSVPLSPAPVRVVDPPSKQWALIEGGDSLVAGGRQVLQRHDALRARRGFPLPIERPPRA